MKKDLRKLKKLAVELLKGSQDFLEESVVFTNHWYTAIWRDVSLESYKLHQELFLKEQTIKLFHMKNP